MQVGSLKSKFAGACQPVICLGLRSVSACSINDKCLISDMSSKVHQTEEGLNALQTGQGTLTSHVNTMNRELTSVRTQQKDLSDRVDRDLTAIRNQQLDDSNAPITTEGMFGVEADFLYTPCICPVNRSSISKSML